MAFSLNRRTGYWYLIPFIFLLVARTYNFGADVNATSEGDPVLKTALEALAYAIAGFLVFQRRQEFSLITARLIPYYLYSTYGLGTMIWSAYPRTVIVQVGHTVGLLLVAICTALWGCERRNSVILPLLAFSFVTAALSLAFVEFWPARGIEKANWSTGGVFSTRWVGVTIHPNALGPAAMIAGWSAIAALYVKRRTLAKEIQSSDFSQAVNVTISLVTLLMAVLLLKGSDSRTTIEVAPVMLALTFAISGTKSPTSQGISFNTNIVMIGVIFCSIIVGVTLWYGLGVFMPSARGGATDALSGRPEIWAMGLQAVAENPFGWSFDELGTYWRSHAVPVNVGYFGHFHNGYLDVAVKGGIISELLLLLILYNMGTTIQRLRRIDRVLYKFFYPFFVSLLLYSFIESGFDREETYWSVMVVIWVCAEMLVAKHEKAMPIRGSARASSEHSRISYQGEDL
jgi:O-antigen ligase